jgi:hypothetical protein
MTSELHLIKSRSAGRDDHGGGRPQIVPAVLYYQIQDDGLVSLRLADKAESIGDYGDTYEGLMVALKDSSDMQYSDTLKLFDGRRDRTDNSPIYIPPQSLVNTVAHPSQCAEYLHRPLHVASGRLSLAFSATREPT